MKVILTSYVTPNRLELAGCILYSRKAVERLLKQMHIEANALWPKKKVRQKK